MRAAQTQPGSRRGPAAAPRSFPRQRTPRSGAFPREEEVGARRDLVSEPARRERDAEPSPGAVAEALSSLGNLEAWPST